MRGLVHQFLRWAPAALIATALAAASVWQGVRDLISAGAVAGIEAMSNPWIAAAAGAGLLVYLVALFWTGREAPHCVNVEIEYSYRGEVQEIPAKSILLPYVAVKNVGSRNTAATDWRVFLRRGRKEIEADRYYMESIELKPGHTITKDDSIDEKTLTPVASGGIVHGYLAAYIDRERGRLVDHNDWIVVQCRLVDNTIVRAKTRLDRPFEGMMYMPGMRSPFRKS